MLLTSLLFPITKILLKRAAWVASTFERVFIRFIATIIAEITPLIVSNTMPALTPKTQNDENKFKTDKSTEFESSGMSVYHESDNDEEWQYQLLTEAKCFQRSTPPSHCTKQILLEPYKLTGVIYQFLCHGHVKPSQLYLVRQLTV